MICNKCGKELDDKLLICPECGNILKQEEDEYHHNYATESIQMGAAKLTEEEIDYEASEEVRDNALVLFKNIFYLVINLFILVIYGVFIFGFIFLLNDFEVNMFFIIEVAIIVPITLLSFLSYELLFYKARKNVFLGFVPIIRYKVLLSICNDEQLEYEIKKLIGIFLAYLLYYLCTFSDMYTIAFIDYWIVFLIMSLISSVIYFRIRIKFLGDLSERFRSNKYERLLTIIFPFIMILIFAFNKKEYTSLRDSYL